MTIPPIFDRLIDDAAVFPPGDLPLADAVPAHVAHRSAWYSALVGPLPGKRSSPARLGPWAGRHDPGWELVGPQHADAADAARAIELEDPRS